GPGAALVTHLLILQGIQRHIELQYIDHRLAKEGGQGPGAALVTHLLILQGIQRHIELQYIDHRLAKE
ncbi:hypothetical protein CJ430_31890, partial [Klebsiella pneumoniae]